MIESSRPDTIYEWQSEDLPPVVFTKHFLEALKIGYINEVYPFKMLNLRTASNDTEWWYIDGVYDDNIVIGYFTITVAHAGSPWKGYVSVYRHCIRAVNSKKGFFTKTNPCSVIANAMIKVKSNYFKNCMEDNMEIIEWRRKAKELRIERASIK